MSATRARGELRSPSLRSARTLRLMGGIPVEYKGGSIPPPDQRRSYN
jgi:hypothetical protein